MVLYIYIYIYSIYIYIYIYIYLYIYIYINKFPIGLRSFGKFATSRLSRLLAGLTGRSLCPEPPSDELPGQSFWPKPPSGDLPGQSFCPKLSSDNLPGRTFWLEPPPGDVSGRSDLSCWNHFLTDLSSQHHMRQAQLNSATVLWRVHASIYIYIYILYKYIQIYCLHPLFHYLPIFITCISEHVLFICIRVHILNLNIHIYIYIYIYTSIYMFLRLYVYGYTYCVYMSIFYTCDATNLFRAQAFHPAKKMIHLPESFRIASGDFRGSSPDNKEQKEMENDTIAATPLWPMGEQGCLGQKVGALLRHEQRGPICSFCNVFVRCINFWTHQNLFLSDPRPFLGALGRHLHFDMSLFPGEHILNFLIWISF